MGDACTRIVMFEQCWLFAIDWEGYSICLESYWYHLFQVQSMSGDGIPRYCVGGGCMYLNSEV